MNKTINGKTWKEIMKELEADFPQECIQTRDYDGVPYISIDDMRNRMDSVIGIDHYNEIYRTKSVEQIKETIAVTVQGCIEILDDNYEVMFRKESSGSSTITFPYLKRKNNDGKMEIVTDENGENVLMKTTTSFANDCKSAEQDAFKRILKTCFHIGLKQLLEKKADPVYTLKVLRDANTSQKNIYIDVDGADSKVKQIVVFGNKKEEFLKAVNGKVTKGMVLSVTGQENEYKGTLQLAFGKFVKPKQAMEKKDVNEKSSCTTSSVGNAKQVPEKKATVKQLTLYSNTPVAERREHPGDYSLTAKSEATGEIYNLVVKGEVAKNMEQWNAFYNATQKEPVKFSFEYVDGMEGATPVMYLTKILG